MRYILLLILFIGYFGSGHCQTFKGTVYDQSSDSTLCSAIIYISGTSVGTYSDVNGNFELDISRFSSMPITISLLGYYSVTLTEYNCNKIYRIYLIPKIKELNEVIIIAKKRGNWEWHLRIFKREFLGETKNAMECDILNEKDLRFSYNSDSNILRAFSRKPIIIKNKALGYTITYYLDKFKYTRYNLTRGGNGDLLETFYLGNYLFKDDLLTLSESEQRIVEERRRQAYLGSRMHFFRSLYLEDFKTKAGNKILLSDNTPFSQIFTIRSKTPINSESFVIKKDSLTGYLKHEGELYITYKKMSTTMKFRRDSVYFQKDGYFDPFEITFEGYMSDQRLGDLLPFEYSLN
ncbi:MAG: carboxypeptidase-like regulatory domain-containing protein [Bacteroidota bacterium]|nr:carboxypeptidase-like regulatory domain-containing protein [Bacteroidota bacterium]